jgi:hypothetical protein
MQSAWENINTHLYNASIEKYLIARDHYIDIGIKIWEYNISRSSGKNKSATIL